MRVSAYGRKSLERPGQKDPDILLATNTWIFYGDRNLKYALNHIAYLPSFPYFCLRSQQFCALEFLLYGVQQLIIHSVLFLPSQSDAMSMAFDL